MLCSSKFGLFNLHIYIHLIFFFLFFAQSTNDLAHVAHACAKILPSFSERIMRKLIPYGCVCVCVRAFHTCLLV